MKKKIILLVFLFLMLVGCVLVGIYWDPIIDWLPIDQSGWDVLDNGGQCYLDEDGDPITGWQELDSNTYYFDPESCAMQIRWLKLSDGTYYLSDEGVKQTGWQTIGGERYYLGDDGMMQTGWQTIGDARYYLGEDGAMHTGWLELEGVRYYLNEDGTLHSGWLEQKEGKYYIGIDGIPMTGWVEADGNWYRLDESGIVQLDMAEPAPYKPGFVNIDGWLFYVQENGHFLKDGDVGELHFGSNYRYTSGDEVLDGYVAKLIDGFIKENPKKDRFALLRVAYDHCVTGGYQYLRRNIYKKGHTGWEIEDAKVMFESSRGNCYNFAAAFWALARGLGYEAYALAGNCTKSVQPHGWVQIEFDGEDYFFDPEWHYDYIHDKREVKDMFMISLEAADWWYYDWTPIKKGG